MSADDNAPEQAECSCSTCYAGNPECGGCDVCNPAPEQAREVEVAEALASVALNHIVAVEDPLITCLCGRRELTLTEWCKHVAKEGAAALAPIRAAERQEAARAALRPMLDLADWWSRTGAARASGYDLACSDHARQVRELADAQCRVFWGTHGCDLPRGHDVEAEPHACGCCDCDDHEANAGQRSDDDGEWVCVARPPYYGPDTKFYGEDAPPETTNQEAT